MEAKNFEYVQVLANKPAGAQSILYWRPFGEATINEIIEKHNKDHVKALREFGWPDNQIEAYGQFMRLTNYDLSEIDMIDLDTFSKVKYVFANLSDLAAAGTAVEHVKANMNQARRKYYLAQFSKPVRPSERDRFIPSPYLPSRPEVIDDQAKLETWLAELDGIYGFAMGGIQPPPDSGGGSSRPEGGPKRGPGSGGPQGGGGQGLEGDTSDADLPESTNSQPSSWTELFLGYSRDWLKSDVGLESVGSPRSLAEIASEVRDTAYERKLSEEDTKALARKAVLQEEILGYVNNSVRDRLGLGITDQLFLDNLRKPLTQITVDDEYKPITETIELLSVRLSEPIGRLSRKHIKIFSELGIDEENSAAIVVTRPEMLRKIEGLGGSAETRHVSLALPFDATDLVR
jgi:hypothetical protein